MAGIWQNMMDKLAGRPTEAEIRRQEPSEANVRQYAMASTYSRDPATDFFEMRAGGMSYDAATKAMSSVRGPDLDEQIKTLTAELKEMAGPSPAEVRSQEPKAADDRQIKEELAHRPTHNDYTEARGNLNAQEQEIGRGISR